MMEKQKAIPEGFMAIGEAAKKLGVTVRTLQHYDKEGLLSPSAVSSGGRRLYTNKDLVMVHQILSLKHLGFSLSDIKNRLIPLDSPAEVASALSDQAKALREKIEGLSQSLQEIETLHQEVLKMEAVDFKKYADIIVNLQMKNDFYWLIKHFDDQMLDHIRQRFDQESGMSFIRTFMRIQEQAIQLYEDGISPDSDQGQALAEVFWKLIDEFTGGDLSLLPKLVEIGKFEGSEPGWKAKQSEANAFIGPALNTYFERNGFNPMQEEKG